MTRKLVMTLTGIALAAPMVLGGCGTVAGIGQDISATGHAVESVATYEAPRAYYHDRYYVDQWGYRHYY